MRVALKMFIQIICKYYLSLFILLATNTTDILHIKCSTILFRSVFDFTQYISAHPTAKAITAFADTGVLVYPSNHTMSYFEDLKDNSKLVSRVARYGDKMIVDQFADSLLLNENPSVLMAIANMGNVMLDNLVQKNR